MRIPSRQHRRINGHRAPMGVVMSYQLLWRRWLNKLHAKLLDLMLADYRRKMGARVDAKKKPPTPPGLVGAKHTTHAVGAAPNFKIVTEEIFHDPALTADIRVLAARVNKQNAIDFRRVVGINLHTEQGINEAIEAFRERNVSLFSTLVDDERERMSEILDEAERGGLRVEDLADRLQDEFGVTESKADFWARDQVLKLNGQLTQKRQTNAGITKYIWTTSGDERVRETHEELDGTVQDWNNPPVVSEDGRTANPGDDYQCRCTAFPILDELDDTE